MRAQILSIFYQVGRKKIFPILFCLLAIFIILYHVFLSLLGNKYLVSLIFVGLIACSFLFYFYEDLQNRISKIIKETEANYSKRSKEEFEKYFFVLEHPLSELNEKADTLRIMISHDLFYLYEDLILQYIESFPDKIWADELLEEFCDQKLIGENLQDMQIELFSIQEK